MKHKGVARAVIACFLTLCLIFMVAGCDAGNSGCSTATKNTASSSEKIKNTYRPGETIKTSVRSEADKKKHQVSYKIEKITTKSDLTKKIIEKYNLSAGENTLASSPGKGMMYAVADYSVRYPSSFPAEEYGIRKPQLSFSITDEAGKNSITYHGVEYKGIGETYETGSQPAGYDFYPGDTYRGQIVYIVPDGCDQYLLKEGHHYIKP